MVGVFGLNGDVLAKGKVSDFVYENSLYDPQEYSYEWMGLLIYLLGHAISFIVSLKLSCKSFKDWWNIVGVYGSRKLVEHLSKLEKGEKRKKCLKFFNIYLSISLKYIVPIAILFITVRALRVDIVTPYLGYNTGVQMVGVCVVAIGALAGILPVFFWKSKEEFIDHRPENPFDEVEEESKTADNGNSKRGNQVLPEFTINETEQAIKQAEED